MTPTAFQIKIAAKARNFFKYLRTHPFISCGYLVLAGFAFVGILFLGTYAGLFGHVPNEH
jgi:penicillin-binding protein 1A